MRMVQRCDRARFAIEALRELIFRNLDGDDAVQPCVACLPHFAHAPGADALKGLVRSEALAPRKAGHDRMNYIRECRPRRSAPAPYL